MKITTQDFIKKFKHNRKAYIVNGNCTIHKEVTDEVIQKHLAGTQRLGLFPIRNRMYSSFFVIDLDFDNYDIAKSLTEEIFRDNIHAYLEQSKGKGYHIWAFFKGDMLCADLRRYMKHVIKRANLKDKKIDLFPRQDEIDEESLGNAINLPYFGINGNEEITKTYFHDLNFFGILTPVDVFNSIKTNTPETITKIIRGFKEELKSTISIQTPTSSINKTHEEETLRKLLKVCKRTQTIRNNCLKAYKGAQLDRSTSDLIYSKHLAELLFSTQCIEIEIKEVSQKYNDSKLRGKAKDNYLKDKVNQMNHLREIFSAYPEQNSSTNGTHFDHLSEDEQNGLIARSITHQKYGKIEESLQNWLEEDFYRIKRGEFLCINSKCGGGKSNLIKQLALTFWYYNIFQKQKDTKQILIAVERIQDGLRLERVLSALRTLKVRQEPILFPKITKEQITRINNFIEEVNSDTLSEIDLIQKSFKYIEGDIELELPQINHTQNNSIVFKCAPSSKICLEGYDDFKLQGNICQVCERKECPANPQKVTSLKSAQVGIVTHNALLSGDNYYNLLLGENEKFKSVLLIDEKPDVLKTYHLDIHKDGLNYKTSIDKLLDYLVKNDTFSLFDEILNSFLKPLKERFAKTNKEFLVKNPTKQKNDIYKKLQMPNLSYQGRQNLKKLKEEIKKDVKQLSYKRRLMEEIELIETFENKEVLASFGDRSNKTKLSFHTIMNEWPKFINNPSTSTILLDATANIDPTYSATGAPHIQRFFKDDELIFPNLKIYFFEQTDIHKGKVTSEYLKKLANHLNKRHENDNKLIVSSLDVRTKTEESIKKSTTKLKVDHFNNLKGKNDYIDCSVIMFTNILRRNEMDYLLIAEEILKDKKLHAEYKIIHPRKWQLKRGKDALTNRMDSTIKFNDPFIDNVRTYVDLVEIIQTIFRTSLRRDNAAEVHVYLPISSSGLVKKIIHYFRGATVAKIDI